MIYIASPFFNSEQTHEVDVIEETLNRCGYEYFSPRRSQSSPYYSTLTENDENFELVKRLIFLDDVNAIVNCDTMVVNPNNLDSGTLWEMGVAISRKMKIIPSFNKYIPGLTQLQRTINEKINQIDRAYIIKALGKHHIQTIDDNYFKSNVKYVIAESPNSKYEYTGLSKVICGYLWDKGYQVIYVDVPRKSNLMLTCSSPVYEVPDDMAKLDELLEHPTITTFEKITNYIHNNCKQVYGMKDE